VALQHLFSAAACLRLSLLGLATYMNSYTGNTQVQAC